jgi:hypothetical protein
VLSNAATLVSVAGQEMTVAEAIEMKQFIAYTDRLCQTLSSAYNRTREEYQQARERVKARLDKLAMEVLGKNASAEKYQSLATSFLEREGVELLDPTDLAAELERRQAFVEAFRSTVDRVLSISNARTEIDVPD